MQRNYGFILFIAILASCSFLLTQRPTLAIPNTCPACLEECCSLNSCDTLKEINLCGNGYCGDSICARCFNTDSGSLITCLQDWNVCTDISKSKIPSNAGFDTKECKGVNPDADKKKGASGLSKCDQRCITRCCDSKFGCMTSESFNEAKQFCLDGDCAKLCGGNNDKGGENDEGDKNNEDKGDGGSKPNKCENKCIKRCCNAFDCNDEDTLLDVQRQCQGDECKSACKKQDPFIQQLKCENKCFDRGCKHEEFNFCQDANSQAQVRAICEGENCKDAFRGKGGKGSKGDKDENEKECRQECELRCCKNGVNDCSDVLVEIGVEEACKSSCKKDQTFNCNLLDAATGEGDIGCDAECVVRCCATLDCEGNDEHLFSAIAECSSVGCEKACQDGSTGNPSDDDETTEDDKPEIKDITKCEKQCFKRCCKDELGHCRDKESKLTANLICSGESCLNACISNGETNEEDFESIDKELGEETPAQKQCEQTCVSRCCEGISNCNTLEAAIDCLGENCSTACTVPVIFDVEEDLEAIEEAEANEACKDTCFNRCCVNLDCENNETQKNAALNTCEQDCNGGCPISGSNQCEQDCVIRCCNTQGEDCSNPSIQDGLLNVFCNGDACQTGCGGTASTPTDEETSTETEDAQDQATLNCEQNCVDRCCSTGLQCIEGGAVNEQVFADVKKICKGDGCKDQCKGGSSAARPDDAPIVRDSLVDATESLIDVAESLTRELENVGVEDFDREDKENLIALFSVPGTSIQSAFSGNLTQKKCKKKIASELSYLTSRSLDFFNKIAGSKRCDFPSQTNCYPSSIINEFRTELAKAIKLVEALASQDTNGNGVPDACETDKSPDLTPEQEKEIEDQKTIKSAKALFGTYIFDLERSITQQANELKAVLKDNFSAKDKRELIRIFKGVTLSAENIPKRPTEICLGQLSQFLAELAAAFDAYKTEMSINRCDLPNDDTCYPGNIIDDFSSIINSNVSDLQQLGAQDKTGNNTPDVCDKVKKK